MSIATTTYARWAGRARWPPSCSRPPRCGCSIAASRFMTISRRGSRRIAKTGIPREQIEVNYIGVDPEAYGPGQRAPPSHAALPRPAQALQAHRGRARRPRGVPEATLDIAGDGDQREAVEAEIERRGLGDRVRMHGHVSEERKLELLQRAWVNLTASAEEGWCLTVMEAAACATPSAAVSVGGLPESVVDGETGLLAATPDELAEQTQLLVRDHELRERLGSRARERAREFTWDRTAKANLALLEGERAVGSGTADRLSALAASDTGRAASLAAAVIASNAIALAFTIVFARVFGASGYGSLAALVSAFIILMVPGSALQIAVAREISSAEAANDPRAGGAVTRWLGQLGWSPRWSRSWPSCCATVGCGDQRGRGLGGRGRAGHQHAVDDPVGAARRAAGLSALLMGGRQHRRRVRQPARLRLGPRRGRSWGHRRLPGQRALDHGRRACCCCPPIAALPAVVPRTPFWPPCAACWPAPGSL